MEQDNTRIWRSLLQLAQATHVVLEREVPESEGLPTNGVAVLQLLHWHGGKTLGAIAAFVGVTTTTMDETIREMIRLGLVRRCSESSSADSAVFELAPLGVDAGYCAFPRAQRADLDPGLNEGPDDCPSSCSTYTPKCVNLGTESEGGA